MCAIENDIPRRNCQDIREIFKESSENELLCYPVLTVSEPGKILKNIGESMDSEAIQMDSFYTELTN